MIKAEFGIIEDIHEAWEYSYTPEKYNCVAIDDSLYLNDWWPQLSLLKTYFHTLGKPALGLDRWGTTIIPPESLPAFQDIVLSDRRFNRDPHLTDLADLIHDAILRSKYVIHYGV